MANEPKERYLTTLLTRQVQLRTNLYNQDGYFREEERPTDDKQTQTNRRKERKT